MQTGKMNFTGLFMAILGFLMMIRCSSDSAPDPVDCTANPVELTVSTVEATCGIDDGSLTVAANGGSGSYMYSVNGMDFQSAATFENLGAGNYTVVVMDANECSVEGSAIVESTSGLMLTTSVDQVAGCDTNNGELSVEVTGGTSPYQYRLDDGSFQDDAVFSGLGAGEFTVVVQDINGCLVSADLVMVHGTSLEEDVMPVITANCSVSGCHDGDSGIPDWSVKANVIANATNIKNLTVNGTMPPAGRTMTEEDISTIVCWVDDGAEDN